MAIDFQCPECKAAVRVPDMHAGKKALCPGCKQKIRIPGVEPSGGEAEAAPAFAAATPEAEVKAEVKPEAPQPTPPTPPIPTPTPSAPAPDVPVPQAAPPPVPAATPKSAYIKFACPSCGKMTGFEAKFAGTALPCPVCKVKVMVPEQSDAESFVVGSAPGARKTVEHHAIHAHAPHLHKPAKKKAERAGFPILGALAGVAAIALIITAAVYWPRKIPGSSSAASGGKVTASSTPKTPAPAAQANGRTPQTSGAIAESSAAKPPSGTAPKTSGDNSADAKGADNDAIEIGARADAPPPAADNPQPPKKLPESVADILSTKDSKRTRSDDDVTAATSSKPKPESDTNSEVMKELVKPAPAADEPKADDAPRKTPAPATNPRNVASSPPPRALNPVRPAAPPAPALCPQCLGMGTVPIIGARPYLRFASEPLNAAAAAAAVPWKLCPKCQAGKDPQTLVTAESTRLSGVAAINQHWEELTHAKLSCVETHHVTIRSTMPEAEVRGIALALEQLSGHLEQLTQTTVLSQTRPDTDELLIGWDVQGYMAFVKALMELDPNHDWSLAQTSGGCLLPHRGIFNANRGIGVSPRHMALYQYGELILMQATDNKAPTWLRYGFASYCENAIMHKNLVYAFQYERNELHFSDNWENEIRKFASQGKLKTWDQAFLLQPIGMTALDYLTCYSMVTFMMNTDAKLFPKYCLAIKEGLDSEKAFEKVYNTDVKKLQSMWSTWALTLRN